MCWVIGSAVIRKEAIRYTKHCIGMAATPGAPCLRLNSGRWKPIPNFNDLMKANGIEPPRAGYSNEDGGRWCGEASRNAWARRKKKASYLHRYIKLFREICIICIKWPMREMNLAGVLNFPFAAIYARSRRLAHEFSWVLAGQAVAAIGAIVGIRFLTKVLEPGAYGEVGLATAAIALPQQILFGPLASATLRSFSAAAEANCVGCFIGATKLLFHVSTGLLAALSALLAIALLGSGQSRWLPLLFAAVLLCALSGSNSLLDGIQNAARHRSVVAWHQAVGQWLRYVLAVTAVFALGPSGVAAMLGYALAAAVVLCSQVAIFRRKIRPLVVSESIPQANEVKTMAGRMCEYGWPFAVYGIFTWAQIASDRWALQYFRSTSDVGLYQALYQVSYYPVTLASGLVVQLVTPILFATAGDGSDHVRVQRTRHLVNTLVGASIGSTLLAVVTMVFLRDRIFALLVAPQYRPVASLAPAMTLAAGLFASAQVAVLSLLISVETRLLIVPKVATAIVGAALSFLGASVWGIKGVVAGSVAFSMLYLIWILFLVNRRRGSLILVT